MPAPAPEAKTKMVRAGGLEPPRAEAQRIFLPATAFAAAWDAGAPTSVRGLDYPFTMAGKRGDRCCPSSLYTFPQRRCAVGLARDCHLTGSPEFGQFCTPGFPGGTQHGLSPVRLPIPPRPQSGDGIERQSPAAKTRREITC
jgi:hypothetical protein